MSMTFLAFVDCIIKTEDGKNHIIDWKTCSWGWDARRKSDTMTTYQLSYYKHFYSEMSGLSFDDLNPFCSFEKNGKTK